MSPVRGPALLIATISAVLLGGWASLFGAMVGGVIGVVVLGALGLALGALYGLSAGSARAYEGSVRGVAVFALDHTWSVLNTGLGALFLLVNLLRGNGVDAEFTRHRGHLGLREGLLRGWSTTIGPVQAGTDHRLDRHEAVHVLQARLFGPLYFPLVGVNYVVATVLPYWLLYHDGTARPIDGVRAYFRRGVYPHTWHEEWAYRVQGTPPA